MLVGDRNGERAMSTSYSFNEPDILHDLAKCIALTIAVSRCTDLALTTTTWLTLTRRSVRVACSLYSPLEMVAFVGASLKTVLHSFPCSSLLVSHHRRQPENCCILLKLFLQLVYHSCVPEGVVDSDIASHGNTYDGLNNTSGRRQLVNGHHHRRPLAPVETSHS
ncbi:hypothetical protein BKA93DRAFT_163080 [Sparassis latifolia]